MKLGHAQIPSDQAQARLSRRRFSRGFRRTPPDRLELVHFPFYCFALQVEDRGRVREIWAGADGVLGTLVLLDRSHLQMQDQDQVPEFTFLLSRSEARAKVEADYRWILYRAKLKRYPCRLLSLDEGEEFWYPYWVGYFQVRGKWNFEVLDAVTGLPVGGPLRLAFLRGLVAWAKVQGPSLQEQGK